jgi:hypothetical protein
VRLYASLIFNTVQTFNTRCVYESRSRDARTDYRRTFRNGWYTGWYSGNNVCWQDVADGVAGDETHTRAGFACTCLHGADQTLTLDVCLLDLCRFLQAYVERTLPGGEHLLTWLLPAFDEHVLGSTQLGRVPAIYLALCAHDVTVCTAFLEHLWQAVLVNDVLHISASEQCDDPPVPRFVRTCTHAATHAPSSTTRRRRSTRHSTLRQSQSAVCHMTSLLSYCKYNTRADLCHRWLYEWMRWCTAYRADGKPVVLGRAHMIQMLAACTFRPRRLSTVCTTRSCMPL